MAFYSMKSLALASALAISAAGAQAATIELFAVPGAAVANPWASSTGGTGPVYQNVYGCRENESVGPIACPPEVPAGSGDARSVWFEEGGDIGLLASDPDALYSSVSSRAWAMYSLDSAKNVLELVWGSVDDFALNGVNNVIEFFLDGVSVGTVDGADVASASLGAFIGNGRTSTGVKITGITFDSFKMSAVGGADAFEYANLKASVVPLPAGGLLLISALGAIAALRRRKTV